MDFNESSIQLTLFIVLFLMVMAIITAFILIKDLTAKIKVNNGTAEGNKLKLAAYERLTLFVDRCSLKNIVSRSTVTGLNVVNAQLAFQEIIKSEYDYNTSQQLYVPTEVWKAVTDLKDQNIYIINQIAAMLPPQADGIELSRKLLEFTTTNNAELSNIVLEALRYEAKKIL